MILAMFMLKINSTHLFTGGWEGSVQYYATIFMISIGTYIDIKNE
jgi:hypothetical protein